MNRELSESDRRNLEVGSGLESGTIRSRGYWTATKPEELRQLGFAESQLSVPALVVPIHTVDGGEPTLFQARSESPRVRDGKPVKYETVAGHKLRIDVPPSVRRLIRDPKEPLWITEGAKKADAAAQRGFCCIALIGVWNWRGKGAEGGVAELADWDAIAIKDRVVYIAFDNDVMSKPSVQSAMVRLAAMLKRRGAKEVLAIVFPGAPKKVGFDDYFVNGGTVAELEDGEFIDEAVLNSSIDIAGKSLPEITDRALRALLANDDPPKIYVRASQLVRVTSDERGTPRIDTLSVPSLRGMVAGAVEWKKSGKNCFPPKDVAENLIHLGEWPDVPGLVTNARAPVVTPSGRVTAPNGYDLEAKVFVQTGEDIPAFEGDAAAAAKWIFDEVLVDFPFATESDRAHALALMLLPIVRPFINGPTPLHLFDAPVQGTGKSLAATVCLIPTQGTGIVVTPGTHDEEEWRKKIAAGLLSGAPYILFDNLSKKVDSDTLATCLTGTTWNDRMLGSMSLARAEIRCAWIATANNADLSRDILRRTAWIRLDSKLERPEDRSVYKHKYITEWVGSNRAVILSALIRMVTEWISVRKPNSSESVEYDGRKLGTFENWSSVMGSILSQAKVFGFLGNVEELRSAASTEDMAWGGFFDRWYQTMGPNTAKASQLLSLFLEDETLSFLVGDKSDQSKANRLGRALQGMVGVVRNGKRLRRAADHSGSATYALELIPSVMASSYSGSAAWDTAQKSGLGDEMVAKQGESEQYPCNTHVNIHVEKGQVLESEDI
jgi:hypothetical protein